LPALTPPLPTHRRSRRRRRRCLNAAVAGRRRRVSPPEFCFQIVQTRREAAGGFRVARRMQINNRNRIGTYL